MLTLKTTGLQAQTQITLEKVVNEWSFYSPSAEKIRLTYDNISMTHKKYLKGFLPLITININPVSFNHSLRLMQNSTDENIIKNTDCLPATLSHSGFDTASGG